MSVGIGNMCAQPAVSFSMSPIPGVTITTPESSAFADAIQSVVDPAVLPDIRDVLQFCYVLKNNTGKFIVLYSTRWALPDASGQITPWDATWYNLATPRNGDAIAEGSSRLVSPIFRLGISGRGPTGPALAKQLQRMLLAFRSKQRIPVSLETIILEDGKAMGADATNAIARARGYLDGERQFADLVSRTVADRGDVRQLLSTLAAGPKDPRTYGLSHPPQYEEYVTLRQQNLATALLGLVPPGTAAEEFPNRIQERLSWIQASVAAKRNLHIAR